VSTQINLSLREPGGHLPGFSAALPGTKQSAFHLSLPGQVLHESSYPLYAIAASPMVFRGESPLVFGKGQFLPEAIRIY
jgi:hypothetical protein